MISKDILHHIQLNHQRLLNELELGLSHNTKPGLEGHQERLTRYLSNIIDYSSAARMEVDPDPRAQIRRAGGWEAWVKQGITKPKFKHP